jgi:hypothetical protein
MDPKHYWIKIIGYITYNSITIVLKLTKLNKQGIYKNQVGFFLQKAYYSMSSLLYQVTLQ